MVIEAELVQKGKTLVWKVEVVTREKQILEIRIDSETAAVIAVDEEITRPKRGIREI